MAAFAVHFIGQDGAAITVQPKVGETAFQALRRFDPMLLDAHCGGAGTCGKCRVRVVSGQAAPPLPEEVRRLGAAVVDGGLRLACRLLPASDITIVAAEPRRGQAVIREAFAAISGRPCPRIREEGTYGVAVDIGTTTIAAYLVEYAPRDGEDARVAASASTLNSQRAFGADVIARIDYVIRTADGLATLSGLIRADIRGLIDRLLSGVGAAAESLREIAVVGNTTMLHLFASIDPSGIAVAPFAPAFIDLRRGKAVAYALPYPRALLILGPSVAGFVGADLVAAARAVDLQARSEPALLLDLGTNGEMAVGDRTGVIACAAAAGPAFEGASLSCGMGGVAGAVDSLSWTEDGCLAWTVIGGGPVTGICGSGIIDAVSCLVRAGAVDMAGALGKRWKPDGYPLATTASGFLRLTQADIRQIQLAKAAVAGGIATLLKDRGISYADVGAVFLAGGFGSALKAESAGAIGLLPSELLPKVVSVGNAAGHGAVRLLLFKDEPDQLQVFANSIHYLELSGSAYFNDRFVDALFFPAPNAVLPAVVPRDSAASIAAAAP